MMIENMKSFIEIKMVNGFVWDLFQYIFQAAFFAMMVFFVC